MDALREATEEVYRQFSRYARPTAINFCPCGCTTPEEVAPLLEYPLREIPFTELDNYAFSAMTTQGNNEDFLYFLPRLLERLSVSNSLTSPEIIFGKLAPKFCPDLSPEDRHAIAVWVDALWTTGLASFPIENRIPDFFSMEEILICIAQVEPTVHRRLQVWTDTKTWIADQHLIQFVADHGQEFAQGRTITGAGWKYTDVQGTAIRQWILSKPIMKRIVSLVGEPREEGTEPLFQGAMTILKQESAWNSYDAESY